MNFMIFWQSKQGQAIQALGHSSQKMARYLLKHPNLNTLGVGHVPVYAIAASAYLNPSQVKDYLQQFIAIDFCAYDFDSEYIWILDHSHYQGLSKQQFSCFPQKKRIELLKHFIHQ